MKRILELPSKIVPVNSETTDYITLSIGTFYLSISFFILFVHKNENSIYQSLKYFSNHI